MKKAYFKTDKNTPEPIRTIYKRQVRFEEVDLMGVVWHGRYPGYFEEARVALSAKYGIGYTDFMAHDHPVPIRKMNLDYVAPLRFADKIEIETILHWSDAAKISFEYIIRKGDIIVCTGYTVQMMLDKDFNVMLEAPAFYMAFIQKWQRGELT